LKTFIAFAMCYLMGAIPFGLIIGKLTRGIDIRDFGSGNIGASNVLRTLGVGPAILVFVFDTLKGTGAVLLCSAVGMDPYLVVAGGMTSVLGHTFSCFLGFRGGKGVATSLGVIVGLNWLIAAIALGIWAVIVAATRYISLGSIVATAAVPLMMFFWDAMDVPEAYRLFAAIAAVLIIVKHRSNVARLISGAETRIGQKVDTSPGAASEADDDERE